MEEINQLDIIPNASNNINYERKFLIKFLINQIIFLPIICANCGNNRINLTEKNTIANPYIGRCTYNKCRKIYYLKEKNIFR